MSQEKAYTWKSKKKKIIDGNQMAQEIKIKEAMDTKT